MLELSHKIYIQLWGAFQQLPGTSQSKMICSFSLGEKPVTFLKSCVLALSRDRRQEWLVCIYMCIHVYLS